MTFKQFLTVFGGFGLFLGSLGAVQLFVVSEGRVIPSLLMLLAGLAIGFIVGLYRVIQLRHSAAARASLAAQPQPSLSSVFPLATSFSCSSVFRHVDGRSPCPRVCPTRRPRSAGRSCGSSSES